MKAFLLAAGLGTRLRPLTNNIPKCLVDINGRPLLSWWIDLFEEHKISEVLINLHYLPEAVELFLKDYHTSIKFTFFYEEKLLGSAGTLKANEKFIEGESDFFVCYADNLTNYDLTSFYDFHKKRKSSFSMALFRTDTPKSKGIVELNRNKLITSFEEKPQEPKTNLANAGIYLASKDILELIPNKPLSDIGFDLLPQLVNKMYGWESDDYLLDIGTLEYLKQANNEWPRIINRNKNEFK